MLAYFQPQLQFFRYIPKTFEVLEKRSQDLYLSFIVGLTEVIKEKSYQQYTQTIYHFYFDYILHRP